MKIGYTEKRPGQKELTVAEIEHWGMILGGNIHLAYVDVACLEHLLNFAEAYPSIAKKFSHCLGYFKRMFFDRLYFKIYRLLDNRQDVMSLRTLFVQSGHEQEWNVIKENETFIKVKAWRHKMLAHLDKELALDDALSLQFYEENKVYLPQIDAFLSEVNKALENLYDTIGCPTRHIGLGDSAESREFREMLYSLSDKH